MTKDEIRDWTFLEVSKLPGLAIVPVAGVAYYRESASTRGFVRGISVTYSRDMIGVWRNGSSQGTQETMQGNREGEVSSSGPRHSSNGGG